MDRVNVVKSTEVVGVSVENRAHENLGKIEEVMLDKLTGKVNYVVLSFGGVFGIGDKLFALPWNAISYDTEEDCFILDKDKKSLENAPGFDKKHWPDMNNRSWEETIYKYYGSRPYWLQ
jgi:sporulation protein YlmC with PRC-barrel domain